MRVGVMVSWRHGAMVSGMRLSVLQLDDGYTSHWGDWWDHETHKAKFPSGLRGAAQTAAARGLVPGLWVAPWAADKGSNIVKRRPEWMLQKRVISPHSWWRKILAAPYRLLLAITNHSLALTATNSGLTHPGKWFYGLDATNPVFIYLYTCIFYIYKTRIHFCFNVRLSGALNPKP